MKKSQIFCFLLLFLSASSLATTPSVLLPFSEKIPIEKIEQTDLYARADDGDMEAQFQLACFYQKNDENYKKIVSWLTKSALQGHMESQFALGHIYHYGKKGVLADVELSEQYYTMAAAQGDKDAVKKLELLKKSPSYKMRSKPSLDEKWQLDWLSKTSGYGDSDSQYELGRLFEEGVKLPKNDQKAFDWYEKSAKQNRLEAIYALGRLYAEGKGVEKNILKAIDWYEKAALQDYIPAQQALHKIYLMDENLDFEKAFRWLYLSVSFMFRENVNPFPFSPQLAEIYKKLTPEQKESALFFIHLFIQERRSYVVDK